MVNETFSPGQTQQTVLDVFAEEYQVNPRLIRDQTDINRQRVNDVLNALENAGWVEKRCHGLYRLVYDGTGFVDQQLRYKTEGGS